MSKERDLLIRVCVFLDSHMENDGGLISDIKSLLSQPNEEKLTMTQRLEEYKKGYLRAEQHLKREPLSDETIAELWGEEYSGKTDMVKNFARAIEKAHGIGVDDE